MRIIIFCIIFLFPLIARCQPAKEQLFSETVKGVVSAFSKQDSAAVAKFIYSKEGIYLLHRVGVFDQYNHYKAIGFATSYPMVLLTNAKDLQWLPLEYAALPGFNCDSEKWSKNGLFVDTAKTDHLLSQLCENRNKNRPDTISPKTINQLGSLN